MNTDLISFFSDPVLRGPTIATLLMSLFSAIAGVLVFVTKRTLIGETLSHASYPGVTLAVALLASFLTDADAFGFPVLVGAFATAFLGLLTVEWLSKKAGVRQDAALCFVLSSFFGIGITLASYIQFSHPKEFRRIAAYLYGQAATMTDIHIIIYSFLFLFMAGVVFLFYKEILSYCFDSEFAKINLPGSRITQLIILLFVTLAVIIGIRSVGVVLMSAMLIAPPIAARQFTNSFAGMLGFSLLFSGVSTFLGVYTSVVFSQKLATAFPSWHAALPTGPTIVLTASAFALLSLAFAPKRGLVVRFFRVTTFRWKCHVENILKILWKEKELSFQVLRWRLGTSRSFLLLLLFHLYLRKSIKIEGSRVRVTFDGEKKGMSLTRLHRLWELYLTRYLGMRGHEVHKNAEEIEHILTPELERELTSLLDDPKQDPHNQPIPGYGDK